MNNVANHQQMVIEWGNQLLNNYEATLNLPEFKQLNQNERNRIFDYYQGCRMISC